MIGVRAGVAFLTPFRDVIDFFDFGRAVEGRRSYGFDPRLEVGRLGALPTPLIRGLWVEGPAEGVE